MNFSVIVCARKEGDSAKLRDSFPPPEHGCIDLVEVVGAPGMSVGFNKGVKKAKHDILLFTHTDVHVWAGVQLLEEMLDVVAQPSVGFVGVAGSDSLRASCRWWESERKHGCVAHRHNDQTHFSSFGPLGRALVMDGVFLACERKKLERIGGFDERFKWHFYDIDATLRTARAGYRNEVVAFPILHESIGPTQADWMLSAQMFRTKYNMTNEGISS